MDLGIGGRLAVVVGTGTAAGAACAGALAAEGADVVRVEDHACAPETGAHRLEAIDILVVAAAPCAEVAVASIDTAVLNVGWERVVAMSAWFRAALPAMKRRGRGRLIYVGTGAAREIDGRQAHVQRAVDLGALGLMKALSGEIGPAGVTCNSVLWRDDLPDRQAEFIAGVAAAVAYLASDNAAYLTGDTLTVDGATGAAVF
ncbi:MAG: hypothetical protein AB7Q97_18875 [Gammaproteobacteria bacterium]